jgi:hypothetical protein
MMIITVSSNGAMFFSFEGCFVILLQETEYLSISQNLVTTKYIPHMQNKKDFRHITALA